MTTRGVPRPTSIHFTIDGCHASESFCILPVVPSFSEGHGPHTFQGTSTNSIILRNKLPPGILFVDVVLCTNLFPFQHSVQRHEAILNALFYISEGFYFGPPHLIMASLIHFHEKSELSSDTTLAAPAPSTSAPSMPIPEAAFAVLPDASPASEPSITISTPKFPALHLGLLPPPYRDPDPTISRGPHRCLSFG
ncbi:hypothetical protein AAG906_018839 [Vitis piasezkii]